MKKFLLSLLTAAVSIGVVSAADVKDVITIDKWSETTSYAGITDKKFSSTAVYAGRTMKATQGTNAGAIQCQKNKHFLWTTASGGKIKSITVDYKSANSISVYASNTAYTTTNAGKDQQTTVSGDPVATLNAQTTSWAASATDDYKYIALVCGGSAVYLNSITIEWTTEDGGSGEDPKPDDKTLGDILVDGEKLTEAKTVDPETQLTFSCANASIMEVSVGDALASDTNSADNIAWTAPADAGTYNLTIIAMKGSGETFSETSAEFTIIVKAEEEPTADEKTLYWNFSGEYTGNATENALVLSNKNTDAIGTWQATGQFSGDYYVAKWGTTKDNPRLQFGKKDTAFTGSFTLSGSNIPADAIITSIIIGGNGGSAASVVNFKASVNGVVATQHAQWSGVTGGDNPSAQTISANLKGNNIVLSSFDGQNGFVLYDITVKYVVPATATVVLHGTSDEVGNTIELKEGESKRIHFNVADGVEVWHKFVADGAKGIAAQAETDEDGFEKYDGNGVELTQAGTLSYYTKTANGVKSDVQTLTVTGGTSAISEISAEQNGAEVIYDLQGRRVSRAVKGLFIVNGKKELRK